MKARSTNRFAARSTRVSSTRDLPRNCGLAWRAVGVPAAPVDKVRMRYLHDSGALCVNVGGPLPNLIQIRLRSWPAHFFFSECGFAVRSLGSQECAFSHQRALPPRRAR